MNPAGALVTDLVARALMERVLRPGRAASLAAEYPLVFDPVFPGRVVATLEGGDVRSTCALLVRELAFDGARLRVGLIGSVATDPDWRGRGLATRTLDEAEGLLADAGCALALLWADDAAFYARRGYTEVGREVDCLVPASALASLERDSRVRSCAPGDAPALHGLYARHPSRVERTPQETAALLACPGMDTLVLEREHVVAAYACLGRGADFAGTVHEWGGDADDVLTLLGEHARRARTRGSQTPLAVIAPPHAVTLVERLAALDARVATGVLAMGKALAAAPLCGLFERFASPWRAERATEREDAGALVVSGPRGSVELGGEQVLAVLFGARGDRSTVREVEAALGAPAPKLPLAPFVWGLDSI